MVWLEKCRVLLKKQEINLWFQGKLLTEIQLEGAFQSLEHKNTYVFDNLLKCLKCLKTDLGGVEKRVNLL